MVSMKEIAKQCNVSVATVSKALNGYSDIGEETKKLHIKNGFRDGISSQLIGKSFEDEANL